MDGEGATSEFTSWVAYAGVVIKVVAVGIEFSYFFDADHDRTICLDNGWKITLSRGLDIYEKFGRFSLGSVRQTNRRCRAFSVTYVKE